MNYMHEKNGSTFQAFTVSIRAKLYSYFSNRLYSRTRKGKGQAWSWSGVAEKRDYGSKNNENVLIFYFKMLKPYLIFNFIKFQEIMKKY